MKTRILVPVVVLASMRIATASLPMLVVLTARVTAEQADSHPKPPNPTLPAQKFIDTVPTICPSHPSHPSRDVHLGPAADEWRGNQTSIPVGELATRAAGSISDARCCRAERKVEERIERELDEMLKRR